MFSTYVVQEISRRGMACSSSGENGRHEAIYLRFILDIFESVVGKEVHTKHLLFWIACRVWVGWL